MHLTHQSDSKSITTKDRRDKATNEGVSLPSRTIVHAKLEMTSPQDAEELEADVVASEIVSGGKIKRKISQGSTGSSGIAVSSQMESQLSRLQGGGQQMPSGLQSMMENGFGRDLSQVRLHTDSDAATMSSSIHAKAFTHGNDIYFNHGQYSPETTEGQKLVAHELTHVMQENGKVARQDDEESKKFINNARSLWKNYNDQHVNNVSLVHNFNLQQFQIPIGFMNTVHDSVILAIDMLSNAIYFIDILSDINNPTIGSLIDMLKQGVSFDVNPINNNLSNFSLDQESNSKLYKGHMRSEHENLARRLVISDKKEQIKRNLQNIRTTISNYPFEKYGYEISIINNNGEETYGKNYYGIISLSKFFLSENLTKDDRAYALIHEFSHSVLHNQSEEIYINQLISTRYSDDQIISSPDFYVMLCYLTNVSSDVQTIIEEASI